MISYEFLITSLIVVLIPGTGVIYTISNGLFLGKKASIAAAIGCSAGIIPHIIAGIIGLSAIMHMSAIAFTIVKYAGAIYLLYLAFSMWKDSGNISFDRSNQKKEMYKISLKGFLINILNPKLSIFFLAFLPQFISKNSAQPVYEMFILSLIFMALTLIIFIIYGLTAGSFREYVNSSPKFIDYMKKTFAVSFAFLGIKLALTDK